MSALSALSHHLTIHAVAKSLFVAVVFKSVKPFYTTRNYSYIWAYKLFMYVCNAYGIYSYTLICDVPLSPLYCLWNEVQSP